jgi:DnaJ-class molecular chaperone
MRRDYYAVLGIASTAGPREVRQAYRRLARQYSPDVNFWDARAQTLFEEIAEAYRVLNDPGARARYDRFGITVQAGGSSAGRRGDDVHTSVEVAFADAARGTSLDIPAARFSACGECGATGLADGRPCGACGGRGVRRAMEPVRVAIPAGIDNGTEIRLAGEGSAGPFGGPRGDLIVSTRVQEHPFFARKGESVHCEVPISVWEALRGARIRIPTPLGETALVIPPGTSGGQVFRLRGQGLPRLAGEGHGDLHVTVRLDVPSGLDARTYDLIRELERVLPLAPRAHLDRFNGGAT